jgi:hypothetical protein
MTAHNDILLAAAISGVWAGVLDGKDFSGINSASLSASASLTAAVLAAAQEVDQAIPADTELSVSGSNPVLLVTMFAGAGTAAQILPVFTKPTLVASLCASAFKGKGDLASATLSTYTAIAAGIAAQYAAAVAQLPTS